MCEDEYKFLMRGITESVFMDGTPCIYVAGPVLKDDGITEIDVADMYYGQTKQGFKTRTINHCRETFSPNHKPLTKFHRNLERLGFYNKETNPNGIHFKPVRYITEYSSPEDLKEQLDFIEKQNILLHNTHIDGWNSTRGNGDDIEVIHDVEDEKYPEYYNQDIFGISDNNSIGNNSTRKKNPFTIPVDDNKNVSIELIRKLNKDYPNLDKCQVLYVGEDYTTVNNLCLMGANVTLIVHKTANANIWDLLNNSKYNIKIYSAEDNVEAKNIMKNLSLTNFYDVAIIHPDYNNNLSEWIDLSFKLTQNKKIYVYCPLSKINKTNYHINFEHCISINGNCDNSSNNDFKIIPLLNIKDEEQVDYSLKILQSKSSGLHSYVLQNQNINHPVFNNTSPYIKFNTYEKAYNYYNSFNINTSIMLSRKIGSDGMHPWNTKSVEYKYNTKNKFSYKNNSKDEINFRIDANNDYYYGNIIYDMKNPEAKAHFNNFLNSPFFNYSRCISEKGGAGAVTSLLPKLWDFNKDWDEHDCLSNCYHLTDEQINEIHNSEEYQYQLNEYNRRGVTSENCNNVNFNLGFDEY